MSDFFNEDQLSRVAFDLLACSTFDRYERIAKRSSKEIVTTHLKTDPEIAGTLIHEARILWEELLRGEERGVAEIKLATLLPTLRDIASPAADSLLTTVAVCDMPVGVWISALARRLRAERATNTHHDMTTKTQTVETLAIFGSWRGVGFQIEEDMAPKVGYKSDSTSYYAEAA